jgi:hypothetical protein
LSETTKEMLADSEDIMDKRNEKKHMEKEVTVAIYINLTKEAIEVQSLDVEAKCQAEDTKIVLTDLSNMCDDHRSWYKKKRAKIRQRGRMITRIYIVSIMTSFYP